MVTKDYDDVVERHYRDEAIQHGLQPTSTMLDKTIREKETEAICHFVAESLRERKVAGISGPATIMDVGCGNGYTLKTLHSHYPDEKFVGYDKCKELLELAKSRFVKKENVSIYEADIRHTNFSSGLKADILICQRVLINIMNFNDQKDALRNLISVMETPSSDRVAGTSVFIESFTTPLKNLNQARKELDLPDIEPIYHNMYLEEEMFRRPELVPLQWEDECMAPNFLSTHYFIARVIYPLLKNDRSISRNSELVNFFVAALNKNIGDYSPLKVFIYKRSGVDSI
jgi:ubiquinone/menaquinone biosynthesis C-methylase UbiE